MQDVNNHIHTHFSFSPYSPEKAVIKAKEAGLATAGIMDHDSLAGADAFETAGHRLGMPTTDGKEFPADFGGTKLNNLRINNPDQNTIAYIALHAIPKASRTAVRNFMKPYVEARQVRNRIMTRKLHTLVEPYHFRLDYEKDVLPLSKYAEGGSVTERHLLYALSQKLIAHYGKSEDLLKFLKEKLQVALSEKAEQQLIDETNAFATYDLLGVLKSSLMPSFYINATTECPDVCEILRIGKEAGAICAYAYLGDVTQSVTGDKKTQTFEDSYLDLLFDTIKKLGFHAVTYMPSRNSAEQLIRVRSLCDIHQLFQISGEDINSPRQSFVCEAMRQPGFENLADAAWALIGHESASNDALSKGMFADETISAMPQLSERTRYFAEIGRSTTERFQSL